MWTVAKIRADYEGWWLFSDWTEKIVEQHHYSNYEEMLKDYQSIIKKSKKYYNNYVIGKYNIYVFFVKHYTVIIILLEFLIRYAPNILYEFSVFVSVCMVVAPR